MVRVEMLVQTYYRQPLQPGDIIEVPADVAARWEKHGIARPVQESAPEPPTPPKKPKGGKKDDAG